MLCLPVTRPNVTRNIHILTEKELKSIPTHTSNEPVIPIDLQLNRSIREPVTMPTNIMNTY
jgi:hypothetical protein